MRGASRELPCSVAVGDSLLLDAGAAAIFGAVIVASVLGFLS